MLEALEKIIKKCTCFKVSQAIRKGKCVFFVDIILLDRFSNNINIKLLDIDIKGEKILFLERGDKLPTKNEYTVFIDNKHACNVMA